MTMAKIMMGIATLFIGEKTVCNAIAADMTAQGVNVSVQDMQAGERTFDVL